MKEIHYYCNICNEECDTTDCGVKVIQSTALQNGIATPLSTSVKWFVPNSETNTHICTDCRKKLEAM